MKASAIEHISVLLIEPAGARARGLMQAIGRTPRVELLATCKTFEEAYNLTESKTPQVVLISSDLIGDPGFPMYKALLEALNIDCQIVCPKLEQKSGLSKLGKVIIADGQADYAKVANDISKRTKQPSSVGHSPLKSSGDESGPIIVIGSSTGGVEALSTILAKYPSDCPPTLIVQHIGHEFVAGFTSRLNRLCAARVDEARDGEKLERGRVYVAPGQAAHLTICPRGRKCKIIKDPPVSGHQPSVDALFRSAVRFGPIVVAAILTGMGRDGAEGMSRIRQAGGRTFGQNEDSCVVYGMPRVAYELGGVAKQLHIDQIGPALIAEAKKLEKGRDT